MVDFISKEEAEHKLAQGGLVVDVRTLAEWNDGHGPEPTVHIPLDQLPTRFDELSKTNPLLLCCRSGVRSRSAVHFLKQQGFTDVHNLGPWECDPRIASK